MNITPARKSAFEILCKIEKENAFSSILLPQYEKNLNSKDSSLCHQIVLGVLRKKLYLDEIIKKFTKKNINKFDVEVVNALRIGLYQLLILDKIPDYSAINESVNLVKLAKKKSASGMVNAVLRRATREKFEFKSIDQIEKISVETSHPRWLVEKWIKQFGFEEAEKLSTANNEIPTLIFRLTGKFYSKNPQIQSEILESITNNSVESELIENSFTARHFDDNLWELAEKGLIYFQDEGSQMVASTVNLHNEQLFLDVCASPGSKTTFIANKRLRSNTQNIIVAGDLYEHRVRTLKENCVNQNVGFVNLVQYNAEEELPFSDESFDAILVDAPCSGTGTIRNNPEIRYNVNEKDFKALSVKQLKILKNASKLVKHDGRIIYSTCSLEVEENEEVIEKFLAEDQNFELIKPELSEKFITKDNFAKTFPQRDNMDGFFIAVLHKVK